MSDQRRNDKEVRKRQAAITQVQGFRTTGSDARQVRAALAERDAAVLAETQLADAVDATTNSEATRSGISPPRR